LNAPAAKAAHRDRASKLDPFKPIIAELLQQDPDANAPVIAQRLKPHGYDGGFTIIKDYLRTLRKSSAGRRAYVRVEPAPGERCDVDWGHFGALVYNGATRKLYAFCLVESHSRKMYLEFTHSQTFETFARCHIHAFQFFSGTSREIWLDNLATAVAQHDGNLIRFNPAFSASLANAVSFHVPVTSGRPGRKVKSNERSAMCARTSGRCAPSSIWRM
jgi:transposase